MEGEREQPSMITTPLTFELVRGAARLEPTARGLRPDRLPAGVARQTGDGQLAAMAGQPAGVRLALTTTATVIELLSHPTHVTFPGADLAVPHRRAGPRRS